MNTFPCKTPEDRKKETTRIKEEINRRRAEAQSKKAGFEIEKIQRSRKFGDVTSLISRIRYSNKNILAFGHNLLEGTKKDPPSLGLNIKEDSNIGLKSIMDIYNSIRQDFIDVTEISQDKFKKLFPFISINSLVVDLVLNTLFCIFDQQFQMSLYLRRYLIK